MKDKKALKVVITFFLTGALVGILFVWLVSIPAAFDFWFVRGNKFLIPRPNYWLVFGALLTFGLAVSYCMSVLWGWLTTFGHWAEWRRISAILVLLIAFPSGDIAASRLLAFLDPALAYFSVCIVIASLISIALWMFTLTWKTWTAIFMVLAIPVAHILTIVLYKSLNLSNHGYDILRIVFIGSFLSGISGYWLAAPRKA